MRKWTFVVLLVVGATILGGTVLREPIAYAAQSVSATVVGPLDSNGNVAVHEQGTATVAGTIGARPAAPTSPFLSSEDVGVLTHMFGPATVPLYVTSLSVSPITAGQDVDVALRIRRVDSS